MKKVLGLIALGALVVACGSGAGNNTGTNITNPNNPNSGLKITSFSIQPKNTTLNIGQNLTISAQWQSDKTIQTTTVKLQLEKPSSSLISRLSFDCGAGKACQGSFNISCTYENDPLSSNNRLSCTMPDGSKRGFTVYQFMINSQVCIYIYLEATTTDGTTQYAYINDRVNCITPGQ